MPNREQARTSRIIFFSLYQSAAIMFALAGVFVPGPERILDMRLLYLFGIGSAAWFLAFRFKRSVGIIVVVVVVGYLFVILLTIGVLAPMNEDSELATVRVLSSRESKLRLEINRPERSPEIAVLDGDHFAPIVTLVVFDQLYPFFGAWKWYRLEGFVTQQLLRNNLIEHEKQTVYRFSDPVAMPIEVWRAFRDASLVGIGITTFEAGIDFVRAREMRSFVILLDRSGAVHVIMTI